MRHCGALLGSERGMRRGHSAFVVSVRKMKLTIFFVTSVTGHYNTFIVNCVASCGLFAIICRFVGHLWTKSPCALCALYDADHAASERQVAA